MSVTLVQTSDTPGNNSGDSSVVSSFSSNVTAGNLIVAAWQLGSTGNNAGNPATVNTFTDSQGNTWTTVAGSMATSFADGTFTQFSTVFAYAYASASGALSVTGSISNGSGGTYQLMELYELAGADGSSPVDSAAILEAAGSVASPPVTSTGTTSRAGEFGICTAILGAGYTGSGAAGTGWTLDCSSNGGDTLSAWEYQTQSSAGTTVQGTLDSSITSVSYAISAIFIQPPSGFVDTVTVTKKYQLHG